MSFASEVDWREVAGKHWLRSQVPVRSVRSAELKDVIWDPLEKSGFSNQDLTQLEALQLLEQYLWPSFSDESSNQHVLLIALLVAVKRREGLDIWSIFESNPPGFSSLFRRILSLSIDTSTTLLVQNHILTFFLSAFQSLDQGLLRKECAPLVSISLWTNLQDDATRDRKLDHQPQLQKPWKAAQRRYEAADDATKARLRFERRWLFDMICTFVSHLQEEKRPDSAVVTYCERFVELLTDLEGQLPTRRYLNALLHDLNLWTLIETSNFYRYDPNAQFRDLCDLLRHFMDFSVDDHTGNQLSQDETQELYATKLEELQRVSLRLFKEKLTLMALSNYASVKQPDELKAHLSVLADEEILQISQVLHIRTSYPETMKVEVSRELMLKTFVARYEGKRNFQEELQAQEVLPTDHDLYHPSLLRNDSYDGSRSLALPKLNLQYLSAGDFLWRSFVLYRCEAFFEVRKDLEDVVRRMQPRSGADGSLRFAGTSRMALQITSPSILEVNPPKLGSDNPANVRAEIALDVSRVDVRTRSDWERLRSDDVVFLVTVKVHDEKLLLNGNHASHRSRDSPIVHIRAAEVIHVLDEKGRPLKQDLGNDGNYSNRPRPRRLLVNIHAAAFAKDEMQSAKGKPSIYDSINLIVRRRGRENNFKKILESVKSLALSGVPLPLWLHDVFLGYGDPTLASYPKIASRLSKVDFQDTFIDWHHLRDALPDCDVEPLGNGSEITHPPYVLEATEWQLTEPEPARKRRKLMNKAAPLVRQSFKVTTYEPPNTGPYPSSARKLNRLRFTPAQVRGIMSGTQPGLTVIVGPPGTGKTDVATQIISNIYHDFPNQRTLLIAHSNQALNQLFQKITRLDIDERHLLRLGHGEEELDTNVSYGKHGRVESFLDNRSKYLSEVDRLASNLEAPGAHGSSCETAGYFDSAYVRPAWTAFWAAVSCSQKDAEVLRESFPFYQYFSNAPQPLFPESASYEELVKISEGCQRHIDKIFTELEDIRPFEILRGSRDRANYLLTKEARIIAMTSTHAAIRQREIASLGFHYDNVIMEEAAQITEIENFIPTVLQNAKDGAMPLQRVVLCGDHLQNSPVIQNLALRQFSNLDQSLFLRLVRLGVPTVNLDLQGRARSGIAELYKWRYHNLGDLPAVLSEPEFLRANAGFGYDYQFIDTPDYKGQGETQPNPHFIQNLGEAEYAVAIYQYMRLLGYPASRISMLTTYAGQRALIRDILSHRCTNNRLFGMPRIVTTVDKYQGEQNDYVILSLVRTKRVGYLRDIRRLTVALSRARLGLYILGRRDVMETCFEFRHAFDILFRRSTALMLVPGELHPTTRSIDEGVDTTEMTGVEHLGQYVYEMTQAKIKQLSRSNGGHAPMDVQRVQQEKEDEEEAAEDPGDEVRDQPEELDG